MTIEFNVEEAKQAVIDNLDQLDAFNRKYLSDQQFQIYLYKMWAINRDGIAAQWVLSSALRNWPAPIDGTDEQRLKAYVQSALTVKLAVEGALAVYNLSDGVIPSSALPESWVVSCLLNLFHSDALELK